MSTINLSFAGFQIILFLVPFLLSLGSQAFGLFSWNSSYELRTSSFSDWRTNSTSPFLKPSSADRVNTWSFLQEGTEKSFLTFNYSSLCVQLNHLLECKGCPSQDIHVQLVYHRTTMCHGTSHGTGEPGEFGGHLSQAIGGCQSSTSSVVRLIKNLMVCNFSTLSVCHGMTKIENH